MQKKECQRYGLLFNSYSFGKKNNVEEDAKQNGKHTHTQTKKCPSTSGHFLDPPPLIGIPPLYSSNLYTPLDSIKKKKKTVYLHQ